MQTRNPVLNRITKEAPQETGGTGFAYQEGSAAYREASGSSVSTDARVPASPHGRRAPTGAAPVGVTLNDVVVRTGMAFIVLLVGAVAGWQLAPGYPAVTFVAMFIGLGLGVANIFKKQVSPLLVLLYALVQGVFLGGISYVFDQMVQQVQYEGLVSQAIIGTLTAFGVMLTLYATGIIKVNGRFMKVMMVALISYAVIALISFIAAMFGVGGGFGFYGVGGWGLLLCAFGVLLASFTLMLDFESISQAIRMGLPERESWRLAFGLLVTLIWLYIEILRLLSILALSRE